MCGHVDCQPEERKLGADLRLYSVTLNNNPVQDRETLGAYRNFRIEAEQNGFRHFLEVFSPNAAVDLRNADMPRFVNDSIARLLAGVTSKGRPIFLNTGKMSKSPHALDTGAERVVKMGHIPSLDRFQAQPQWEISA